MKKKNRKIITKIKMKNWSRFVIVLQISFAKLITYSQKHIKLQEKVPSVHSKCDEHVKKFLY